MKKRPIAPYLSVYKPQLGNITSILERISGVTVMFMLGFLIFLEYLKPIFFLNYNFYFIYFLVVKGGVDQLIVIILIMIFIVNFVFHISFFPLVYKRIYALTGTIVDYTTDLKTLMIKGAKAILMVFIISLIIIIII